MQRLIERCDAKGIAGARWPVINAVHRVRASIRRDVKIIRRNDAGWWMAWLGRRRRAWQAAISLGEGHATGDPRIPEWGQTCRECRKAFRRSVRSANALEGDIWVRGGREINS